MNNLHGISVVHIIISVYFQSFCVASKAFEIKLCSCSEFFEEIIGVHDGIQIHQSLYAQLPCLIIKKSSHVVIVVVVGGIQPITAQQLSLTLGICTYILKFTQLQSII